ncbi:hypothetical protein EV702DRAFT_962091, partial [Suillus placidus]
MGVSDPESAKVSGHTFVASAIHNLLPKDDHDPIPDLIIHHSGQPVCEYNNPTFFLGLFPTLFPYGLGGFENTRRPTALGFKTQAKYFLLIADRTFCYHNSFIFVVLNILQCRQAHLQMSFTVSKSNFDDVTHRLTSVTPTILECLAYKLEHEGRLNNPSPEECTAFELLQQVNTLSACILGSQASKIFVRNEIHNYYGYFGLPHIFFMFNPSPAHSLIFQVMFGDKSVDLSTCLPVMPTLHLAQDPVAAANFFEFSYRTLFQHLFGWDFASNRSTPNGGILGFIRVFYGT